MMVQQGDGGAVKTRRNGARVFKNPPQPHMCIQDYVEGWPDPCYVNVLSWGKIAMPNGPSEPVPLWGGMRIPPPRTENRHMAVYAVMANPEILRLNGKNAQDPQERSALIELLLDFVEAMNEGVVFTRCYTVLKDRDITGELKEVWMSVQAKRDREQETQQETWIDVQPPAPQYPQYEMTPEYYYQTNYDQIYQSRQMVPQQYHGSVPQLTQDQHNYGERGRQSLPQNQSQQNCPAYPTPQYQFQQLPRQLVPQFINSNIHPNVNANVSPNCSNPNVNPFDQFYVQAREQPQQVVAQPELRDIMHIIREMHTIPNKQQTMPQYEQPPPPPPINMQNPSQMNVLRLGRPFMGVTQKSNVTNRQNNSPTHPKQTNNAVRPVKETNTQKGAKPKRPVKVLQRESIGFAEKTGASPERGKAADKSSLPVAETENVQVTDLDEEEAKQEGRIEAKSTETKESSAAELANETETNEAEVVEIQSSNGATSQENSPKNDLRRQILNASEEITVLETDLPLEGTEDEAPNQNLSSKPVKTQILVLKRYLTKSNDNKGNAKDMRAAKNAIRLTKLEGQQIYELESDRISAKEENIEDADEQQRNQLTLENDKKFMENRNGFVPKQKTDRPKKSQTVNNIMKNVFKIHPGTSSEDTGNKKKVNNQAKANGKTENDDVYHGYAILRKNETNPDDVTSEIAQISIQDCKDTTEVNTVLS